VAVLAGALSGLPGEEMVEIGWVHIAEVKCDLAYRQAGVGKQFTGIAPDPAV